MIYTLNENIYVFYRLVTLFELSENMKTTKDNEQCLYTTLSSGV